MWFELAGERFDVDDLNLNVFTVRCSEGGLFANLEAQDGSTHGAAFAVDGVVGSGSNFAVAE